MTPLSIFRSAPCCALFLAFICFFADAQSPQTEALTNQTIIALQKADIGKEIITAKINNSICSFDLSTDGLIALKKQGVPSDIIATMIAKSSMASSQTYTTEATTIKSAEFTLDPGLYYYEPKTREYIELDPAVLTNTKQGGFGEALKRSVSGLFNAKAKATLTGREANTKIVAGKPLFVFVFDRDKTGFNDNNRTQSNVESPNEFFLIKLVQGKNDREMVVGKESSVSANKGIDDASKISFHYKKLQKGLFEVSTDSPLTAGEYCFMFGASSASDQGISHKVYDFSIQ